MSLLSIIGGVTSIIDKFITNPEDKIKAKQHVLDLQHQLYQEQIKTNQIEAQHRTIFVAGWRPFIGWVCGASLFWNFVGYPISSFFLTSKGIEVPPPIMAEYLFELMFGMLGLGGFRTFEKYKRIAK